METSGRTNFGFEPDVFTGRIDTPSNEIPDRKNVTKFKIADSSAESQAPARDQWGNGVEFLLSCIAMSVGLGNVWRFPFTAYENGGGAFLIPYIIVLLLIGKPIYFMEMVLGQFSSKGSVKVFDFVPALRGSGVGQTIAIACVTTYYASLMSLITYYLIGSFSSTLPWSVCDPSWTDCFPSGDPDSVNVTEGMKSSSELYFTRTVLRQIDNINDGIGAPGWKLALCLLGSWISVYLVLLKGVKSSGKASYVLAIFPYCIMLILLIKAVTMEGAVDGIIFFIKPDFNKILDPKVWYAAVTQCFFSLSVCFGNVIMYSSYNHFRRNIYRDALIVTSLDTVTSLIAGFTIFGILGNLAHITGSEIKDVVKGGTGLAFISYPEAITKFESAPQVFAVLFFLMLFILGIGSNVAMVSSVNTSIRDNFPMIKQWQSVTGIAIIGFCIGLVYVTPGGQYILGLVDHHGGGFIVYFLGIAQCIGVAYIYGLGKFCNDIEFMLGIKPSIYWRLCWSIITPGILIIILIYALVTMEKLTYNGGLTYPIVAVVFGWLMSALGIFQLPLFAGLSIYKRRNLGFPQMVKSAFRARDDWGPMDLEVMKEWLEFKDKKAAEKSERQRSFIRRIFDKILGY